MAKKKENEFTRWINSIPVGMYETIRKRIISDCRITSQIFTNWKNGYTDVPELAKEKINVIAREISKNEINTEGIEVYKINGDGNDNTE